MIQDEFFVDEPMKLVEKKQEKQKMISSMTSRKKGENPIIHSQTGNPELDRLLSPFCYVRFIHLIRHMYTMTLKN